MEADCLVGEYVHPVVQIATNSLFVLVPTFDAKIGLSYPGINQHSLFLLDRIVDHLERRIYFLPSFNGHKTNMEAGIAYHCNTLMHLSTI